MYNNGHLTETVACVLFLTKKTDEFFIFIVCKMGRILKMSYFYDVQW